MFLMPPLKKLRILDLNARRVGEHDRTQIARCGGGVDRPLVARAHKKWQSPRVVDVRMTEHDGIDTLDWQGQHFVLLARFVAVPLKQPTVEQHRLAAHFQNVTGPGDFAGRAGKCELHVPPLRL